ncbi:MAG: YcgN family cysteine cluster protein [Acidiferrobacterales bacterium]
MNNPVNDPNEFWKTKSLDEMDEGEWESLCDGCGHCCVLRFQDEDTEEIYVTDVVCHQLDLDRIQCNCYASRQKAVPECLVVTPANAGQSWLPPTCAYRLLAEGKPLPDWHHLVSGDRNSVHLAGASVLGRVISEEGIHPDEIEDRILDNRHK